MTGIHSVAVTVLPDGRMDRKNVAAYCGLSVKTLAMHASRGTGPRFVKRGLVFYYLDDLDEWLRMGRSGSTAQARQVAPRPAANVVKRKAGKPVATPTTQKPTSPERGWR